MKWIIIIIFGYKDCYLLILLTGAMCRNHIAETICRPRHTFDVYLDMFKTCHWLSLEFPLLQTTPPCLAISIIFKGPTCYPRVSSYSTHCTRVLPLLSTENYTLATTRSFHRTEIPLQLIILKFLQSCVIRQWDVKEGL
jgi:hypothetical protein